VASGKPIWVFTDTEQLGAVAWSRDGARLAVGGDSGAIHVLNPATGAEQQSLAQSGGVKALAFNPANDQLAVATGERSVRALDASGRELFALTHPADIYALAWSPDGTQLATASADGAVRVFPTDLGALLDLAQRRLTRGMTKVECARYHLEDRCPQIAAQ
jgi:WD40 repeat protein